MENPENCSYIYRQGTVLCFNNNSYLEFLEQKQKIQQNQFQINLSINLRKIYFFENYFRAVYINLKNNST